MSFPGVSIFTQSEALLRMPQLEAVIVATPTVENASLVTAALRAGKHVLVEKPLACNEFEASTLCAEAAKHSVVAMVGENFRYKAGVQMARKLLASGAIGPPTFALCSSLGTIDVNRLSDWRRYHHHEGGFLLDGGVHFVAQLRELFGELSVLGANVGSRDSRLGRYDYLSCHAHSTTGVHVMFTFARTAKASAEGESRLAIFGAEGQLVLGLDELTINGHSHQVFGDTFGFEAEYLDFWQAVRNGGTVKSTFEEGRRDIQFILACLEAGSRSGLSAEI
jgi:predicted dehydrogenase